MKQSFSSLLIRWGCMCLIGAGLVSCKEEENKVSVKVTEKNLCGEVAEVMCHNIFECCEYRSIEARFGVEHIDSRSACRRDLQLNCEEMTAELQYAIDKKRATVETKAMEECLKALVVGEKGCFPVLTEFASECEKQLISGKQGDGKECLNSFECSGDATCAADMKCRSKLKKGEECVSHSDCKSGLYCTTDEGDSVKTCVSLKSAGDECQTSGVCGEGLYCDTEDGTCASYRAEGESCDSMTPCESGNCLPGTCPDGNLCDSDAECGAGSAYCSETYDSCLSDADCRYCENSGYSCGPNDPCDSTCRSDGSSCYNDSDCYGSCSGTGSICYDDYDCNSDETCETAGQCQPDSCIADTCVGGGTCEGQKCGPNYFTPDFCMIDVMDYVGEGYSTSTPNPVNYDDSSF